MGAGQLGTSRFESIDTFGLSRSKLDSSIRITLRKLA